MEDLGVRKRKKGSKNKKKSWRKNTDVADVEEYLETLRQDERTGGPVSQVDDQKLFFVDTEQGNDSTLLNKNDNTKERRVEVEEEDEEVYTSKKQKYIQQLQKEKEKQLKKIEERKKVKLVNVWGQEKIAVPDAFLESTVKRPKVKPKTVGTGKLETEAVVIPDPGISYNPDYDSHQNLLDKAKEESEKRRKMANKWNSKVKMVSVDELKKQSEIWLKEMSQGLNQIEEVQSESDSESEDDLTTASKKTKDRKTKKQKRTQKLLRLQERGRFKSKLLKEKANELYRLKSIRKEIRKEEEEKEKRLQDKLENKEETEKTRTKRLSKYKFQEDPITFQRSEDLTGSLRQMKTEGNLIKDRFKSLQRRNIIEVRRPVVPHRKYKMKLYTRRSYNTPTIRDFNPARKKGR